jgi:hypothetical protein
MVDRLLRLIRLDGLSPRIVFLGITNCVTKGFYQR